MGHAATPPPAPAPATRVLYIGGSPRGGSTILALALAGRVGVVAGGELERIWEDGFRRNRRCSCGKRFRACPWWSRVIRTAFGGFNGVDAQAMHRIATRHDGMRRSVFLPFSRQETSVPETARWLGALARLYVALRTVSGARIIVDSSKSASYAAWLTRVPGIQVRAIHLLRDSRAVAYSWQRRTILPRLGTARASAQWNAYHLPWIVTGWTGRMPVRRLRYEDFAAAPGPTLARLWRWAGRPVGGRRASPRHHVLSGNPVRMIANGSSIREDRAWQGGLSRGTWLRATVYTWPLLAQFGYLRRHGALPPRAGGDP